MKCWRILIVMLAAVSLGACISMPEKQPGTGPVSLEELQAMHAAAQAAYNSDDLALAQSSYEKIVAQAEVDSETWFMLGNIYARKGEHERAIWAYRNSLRMNTQDPRVWNNISVVYLKDAWEAAQSAKKLSVREDPANINSTAIIDVLSGLSFLASNLPPRNPKPAVLSGVSSLPNASLNPAAAPLQQPVLEQVVISALPANAPGPAQMTSLAAAPALSTTSESRSGATLTDINVKPLIGNTRDKTVGGDKPAGAVNAPKPAPTLQAGMPPKDEQLDAFAKLHRYSITQVKGISAGFGSHGITVRATERLDIIGKSVAGDPDQKLVLLKGAMMRVPLLPGRIYRFLSTTPPIVTYQETVAPEAAVSRAWIRFVTAVEP